MKWWHEDQRAPHDERMARRARHEAPRIGAPAERGARVAPSPGKVRVAPVDTGRERDAEDDAAAMGRGARGSKGEGRGPATATAATAVLLVADRRLDGRGARDREEYIRRTAGGCALEAASDDGDIIRVERRDKASRASTRLVRAEGHGCTEREDRGNGAAHGLRPQGRGPFFRCRARHGRSDRGARRAYRGTRGAIARLASRRYQSSVRSSSAVSKRSVGEDDRARARNLFEALRDQVRPPRVQRWRRLGELLAGQIISLRLPNTLRPATARNKIAPTA